MEIEAKFVVPDQAVARKLRALDHLAGFSFSAPTRLFVRDSYFDTQKNDLLAKRVVLRVRRRSDGKTLLTLKTPATTQGAIHIRPEIETELSHTRIPRVLLVNELPPSFKKMLAPIVHSEAVHPMFSISQTRDVRTIRRSRRVIAEWSVDFVKFRSGQRKRSFYELEIELKKAGTSEELQTIADWIAHEYNLYPSSESKFARALTFMRGT